METGSSPRLIASQFKTHVIRWSLKLAGIEHQRKNKTTLFPNKQAECFVSSFARTYIDSTLWHSLQGIGWMLEA